MGQLERLPVVVGDLDGMSHVPQPLGRKNARVQTLDESLVEPPKTATGLTVHPAGCGGGRSSSHDRALLSRLVNRAANRGVFPGQRALRAARLTKAASGWPAGANASRGLRE